MIITRRVADFGQIKLGINKYRNTNILVATDHLHSCRLMFRILLILLFFSPLSASPLVAAPANGEQLYRTNCSACHGIDGRGGAGVPLSLPSFLDSVSDDYIARTIALGRPGRIMPAFRSLDKKEITAIVKFMRQWSSGSSQSFNDASIKGDPVNGRQVFAKQCAVCHGDNAEGGHGTGVTKSRPRDFPIMAPALNNEGFLAAASDSMIKHIISEGREGTPMKSFSKQGMPEKDINDVVSYIRSFTGKSPQAIKIPQEELAPVLMAETDNDLDATIAAVKRAVIGKNFRVIRVQTLNAGMVSADKEDKEKIIIYFCNFKFLNDALTVDPRVGLFLPCRITVMKVDGKVRLTAINPKLLSSLFNNSELDLMCDEMHRIYADIIDEATL